MTSPSPSTPTHGIPVGGDGCGLDGVSEAHVDAGGDGELDERGVELQPGSDRRVDALAGGSGTLNVRPDGARSTAPSTARKSGTAAGSNPRLLELAQGERRQPVAAALVARELGLVDERTSRPARRSSTAAATPAGPAPTTSVSITGVASAARLPSGQPTQARSRSGWAAAPAAVRSLRRCRSIQKPSVPRASPSTSSWDSKDALLYAVGVGAGTDELAFTTENTNGVTQRVLPTFPVVIGWGAAGSALKSAGTFNPAMLVHGTQVVTLHREVPVDGKATLTSTLVAMYDKGKAGVIVTETEAVERR